MGILSFLAERDLGAKLARIVSLQMEARQKFAHCITDEDMAGAAAGSRKLLQDIAQIEHLIAVHAKKYGAPSTEKTSKFGKYVQAIEKYATDFIESVQGLIIDVPEFRKNFVAVMATEKSTWKEQMLLALTRNNDKLGNLQEEIDQAAASD